MHKHSDVRSFNLRKSIKCG